MSKPISGRLHPDSQNSKENSKLILTPAHTLPAEPALMRPFVDAQLLEVGVDPRWIAANARYRRAKTFNRDDVDAAVLECQRVMAVMVKEATETNAWPKPVQPETNDGFHPSDDGKSEDSWRPGSIYSIPEEFKEQEGGNLKDRDVDPRWTAANARYVRAKTSDKDDVDAAVLECQRVVAVIIKDTKEGRSVAKPIASEVNADLGLSDDETSEMSRPPESMFWIPDMLREQDCDKLKDRDADPRWRAANTQYWIATITGNPGDVEAAALERERVMAIMDREANAVAESAKPQMDCLSLSSDERSEIPWRPESIHASSTKFKKHEDDRLKHQAFERLFQILIDSHIVPLIEDPEFWKRHLQECTVEECEKLYRSFFDLFLDSTSDKRKWYELFNARTSARSRNLLHFICERVQRGIVRSHDEKAEDSGRIRTTSLANGDSEVVRESRNAWNNRPYPYGCGARGRGFGTEDDATKSEDSGESGGVKVHTIFEESDEDEYNTSCSESHSDISPPSSPKWSSRSCALFRLPIEQPIKALRRFSSPARLLIPNTQQLFQARQEDDDIIRGRRSLRYSPQMPQAFFRLVGPLRTAVQGPQPDNEAREADKSTVNSEEPENLSPPDTKNDADRTGVRGIFTRKAKDFGIVC